MDTGSHLPDFHFGILLPVLQVVLGLCQFFQSTWLDRVSSVLEVHYCAPGHSRLAPETLIRKFLRLFPDLIQIFLVDYSFVLAAGLIRRVQCSCAQREIVMSNVIAAVRQLKSKRRS